LIARIRGILSQRSLNQIIVDVNGVGYLVYIPLSTYYSLPEIDEPVSLHISTYIREDAFNLFGFLTLEEKEMFEALLKVSNIGPKLALNILSGISVEELKRAIYEGEPQRLHNIPGVGLKTAKRIILELRDKVVPQEVGSAPPPEGDGPEQRQTIQDALNGLINLGYTKHQAEGAIAKVMANLSGEISLEGLIREALKVLGQDKFQLG